MTWLELVGIATVAAATAYIVVAVRGIAVLSGIPDATGRRLRDFIAACAHLVLTEGAIGVMIWLGTPPLPAGLLRTSRVVALVLMALTLTRLLRRILANGGERINGHR